MTRQLRGYACLLIGLLTMLAGGLLMVNPAQADDPGQPARAGHDAYRETKTLTRVFTNADGTTYSFPSHEVTVTADETTNLRGRQRIQISWSGAQPSGGRASNPYGENGLQQEYPVVILQCRGTDDPSLPKAKQLSPQTCWTAAVAQRSQVTRSESEAAWTHDLDADPADKARISGLTPFPAADQCPTADIEPYFTRLTPFFAANGTIFPGCDANNMPPEAAVGAAFPAAELAAFSDASGSGTVQFEVRSDVENESLGCNHKVACSIVVIPINGLSCDQASSPATNADAACRKGGRFPPGSSNFANDGVDQAVAPSLWWSASNWKNRFSIPITFGLPPDACDILDPRPPTGFYGSELLAQAALQWSPAYCLNDSRFKFQLNQMSDEAGWNLMESGGGAAAEVSSEHDQRGTDPVGYAPTAVTGLSIGYAIDRPDNAGEFTHLRLNARLIAKLLTQSYLGSDLGRGHPGIEDNPLAIMSDPEFIELNPGLSPNPQEAGATLLSLSNSSDVIEQLTDYIAHDKDAMDFIGGKADPWGMVVNPEYKDLSMPRPDWPLLDNYIPETQNTCREENPAVYFSQLAAPVTTMRKIAEALLDAWPNVQTRCDYDQSTKLYKLGRVDRQSFGSRFMLGLVSLGDADRYGLRSAALETTKGSYVEPDDAGLSAAIGLTEQKSKYQPFTLDQADVKKSAKAYPGTMVVYTAARLQHLEQSDADKVAQFIRVSMSEGQRPGSGNGELPDGFLPIRTSGVTKPLYTSAREVADAVEAQKEPAEPDPTDDPTDLPGDGSGPGNPGGGVPGSGTPNSDAPSDAPAASASPSDQASAIDMPATQPVSSTVAGGALPLLLLLGGLGFVLATGLRLFVPMPRRRP